MAKVTVNPVNTLQNEQSALTTLNNNFTNIADALEKTLSRDGTVPNEMNTNLDMNYYRVLNLPEPMTAGEPVRKQEVETILGLADDFTNAIAVVEAAANTATTAAIDADLAADRAEAALAALAEGIVPDNSVSTVKLVNEAVTTSKLADDSVTNAKLANMPTMTVKGNVTASTADPADITIDELKTLLNISGGNGRELHSSDYGFVNDGSYTVKGTDNTPMFNAMMADAVPGDVLVIDPGFYSFHSAPDKLKPSIKLCAAAGKQGVLIRDYTPSVNTEGFLIIDSSLQEIFGLTIVAGQGTSGGIAILGPSTTIQSCMLCFLHHLEISGVGSPAGLWHRGIDLSGSNKTSGAPGSRSCIINDVNIFQCTETGLMLQSVKNFNGRGINIVNTPSDPSLASLCVTGTSGNRSENVYIDGSSMGTILLAYAIGAQIKTSYNNNVNISSLAISCYVEAAAVNTIPTVLGVNNTVRLGNQTYYSTNHYNHASVAYGSSAHSFGGDNDYSLRVQPCDLFGANGAMSAIQVGFVSGSGRSISAGGTVNASGAGYAEYVLKRDDCGVIAKGDVFGLDQHGQATDKWDHAVTFGVKSTDPAMTASGLHKWGVGLEGEEYEIERQKVDRQELAGYCPCNVSGTPGDWVVPFPTPHGGIEGRAVRDREITFEQWRKAVGQIVGIVDGNTIIKVGK